MIKFKVEVKFISPYLQAKFSDKAKEELMQDAKQSVLKEKITEENLQWFALSYVDDKGYYVPSIQIEGCIQNSAKDFKLKSKRCSLKEWSKATLFVEDEKNYLNKKKPDFLNTSYPKRKDGNRVKLIHPAFDIGTQFSFVLQCLDDDFDGKLLKQILENGGKRYACGAWRPKFGRFTVEKFEKI